MDSIENDLVRSPYLVRRVFKSYLVATLLSSASVSLGAVVDGIIVGNILGPASLAAVNLVMPILQLFNALYIVLNVGGSLLVSMALGKHDTQMTNTLFSLSMVLNAALSVVLLVVGAVFLDPIAHILCSDASLIEPVKEYLRIVVYTAPIYLFLPALAVYAKVDNAPKKATAALVVANLLNIALDIVFIKVFDLGIAGSSLATSCGYYLGSVFVLRHFYKKEGVIRFVKPKWDKRVGKLLMAGIPLAVASVLLMVRILTLNNMVVHHLGPPGMFVLSVCLNITMISSMFIGGVVQTMQPVAGLLTGTEDYKGVRMAVHFAMGLLLVILFCITLLVDENPLFVANLFGMSESQLPRFAKGAIRLYGLYVPLFGLNYLLIGAYQLTNHNKLAVLVSVLDTVLVIPIMFWMFKSSNGPSVWSAFVIEQLVVIGVVLVVSTYQCFKAKKQGLHVEPVTLLTISDKEDVCLTFSLLKQEDELAKLLVALDQFMSKYDINFSQREAARTCCNVIISNILSHNTYEKNKKQYIDVHFRLLPDSISLYFVGDAAPYDPMEYNPDNNDRIIKLKEICTSMHYSRLMGQNHLSAKIYRPPESYR